jgi:hypothetical protein
MEWQSKEGFAERPEALRDVLKKSKERKISNCESTCLHPLDSLLP